MINWKNVIGGAVSGFLAAVLVDVDAWRKSSGAFDWGLALKRWVSGAIAGALAGAGIGSG